MSTYSVYIHTNKVNGKKYIGVTRQKPERRWNSGKGYKAHPYFYSAIQKYGWDNFDHFIVEVDSPELMYQLEKQYIEYYKTTDHRYGYNVSLGGDAGCYLGKNCGTKEYYEENKDRFHKACKKYYETHKEKERERSRIYRSAHKKEISLRNKEYRALHLEEERERCRQYRQKVKESKDIQSITPLW